MKSCYVIMISALLLMMQINLSSATNNSTNSSSNKFITIPLERRPHQGRVQRKLQEANLTDQERNPQGLPELPKSFTDHLHSLYRRLQYHVKPTGFNLQSDLINKNNYQYFGKLWVGSHLQEMTFIFDTGSAWTWIPNSDCPNSQCSKGHYRYHRSQGYRSSGRVEEVKYGIGSIKGQVVNDDISITSSHNGMAHNVNFISVFEAKELQSLESDGLLGLSPLTEREGNSGQKIHILIEELKKDGVIDRCMFAMYLQDQSQQSLMHYGGYDQAIVNQFRRYNQFDAPSDGIYWMDINSDVHWQVTIYDFRLGQDEVGATVKNIIFDTGSSLVYIPEREWKYFFAYIEFTKQCYFDPIDDLIFCDCNGINDIDYPTISIYMGSKRLKHWFFLVPRDYLVYHHQKQKCGLLIKQEPKGNDELWLMGDPFLRAYYSVYDLDKKRIGLVGIADTIIQTEEDEEDEEVVIAIIIGATVCVVITFFLCICYYCYTSQDDDLVMTSPGRSPRSPGRSPRSPGRYENEMQQYGGDYTPHGPQQYPVLPQYSETMSNLDQYDQNYNYNYNQNYNYNMDANMDSDGNYYTEQPIQPYKPQPAQYVGNYNRTQEYSNPLANRRTSMEDSPPAQYNVYNSQDYDAGLDYIQDLQTADKSNNVDYNRRSLPQ